MRIVLSSIGTLSQMPPMVALGLALRDRSHVVTFCSPEKYRSWIMKVGFPMVSSGREFEGIINEAPDIQTELKVALMEVPVQFVSFRDACKEADVVVASGLQLAAPSITEGLNVPYFYVIDKPDQLRGGYLPGTRSRKVVKFWKREMMTVINNERSYMQLPPIDDLSKYLFRSRSGHNLITIDSKASDLEGIFTGFWISAKNDPSSAESAEEFKQKVNQQEGLMKAVEEIELIEGKKEG